MWIAKITDLPQDPGRSLRIRPRQGIEIGGKPGQDPERGARLIRIIFGGTCSRRH
jgi:hypothetical protein